MECAKIWSREEDGVKKNEEWKIILVQNGNLTAETPRTQRSHFLLVPVQPEQINYPAAELRGIKNLLKNPSPSMGED